MRFRTLEIRWHDSKPISTCDFQPTSFKKARPHLNGSDTNSMEWRKKWAEQKYRLATGGEDNHVRVWMVHPNIRPEGPLASSAAQPPRVPRVEYLATLSRHSAAVNVVRWNPNGELIASAGDDGMIIIWAPTTTPQASTYGSDLSPEELQNEREHWRVRCMFRCTQMQVYDLAWSPNGDYIIAGSTDNAARVFQSSDGKCVHEIAEHKHYVQGVSWDPLNEYIATQSSDRSMHVYRINTNPNLFEVHAVGRNREMSISGSRKHRRTPSVASEDGRGRQPNSGRPHFNRRESTAASDVESALDDKDGPALWSNVHTPIVSSKETAPLTPATSVASTPAMFPPPGPSEKNMPQSSSRRSSFSGSNAPSSPAASNFNRYRSPSPMPALPAIRTAAWLHASGDGNIGLYGDESFTNFFRRLTFSPDGGLLLTPAGHFEDPEVLVRDDDGKRGRKMRPIITTESLDDDENKSCVYVYTRANFARPPVLTLPGHKKASVAVRFNPILFDLRPNVLPLEDTPPTAVLEKGTANGALQLNISGPAKSDPTPNSADSQSSFNRIAAPAPTRPAPLFNIMQSPALSPLDSSGLRPLTPATSKPGTPFHVGTPSTRTMSTPAPSTGSVFALPYRMLYAVVTMDAVAIYDTQQASPICLLTKLHYDEFTDATWSPDGQSLVLSSRDGYCTLIVFDEILSPYHTQQQSLQLQSIAHHNSVPIDPTSTPHRRSASVNSRAGTPIATPTIALPSAPLSASTSKTVVHNEPLTPAGSVDGFDSANEYAFPPKRDREALSSGASEPSNEQEPPKKKRRIVLTRVGDVGS